MNKKTLVKKLNDAKVQLESVKDATSHVGTALQLTAYIREYVPGENMYEDPFFTYFQEAAQDIHTEFPIRKMSMLSAIDGYIRYLGV